LGIILIYRKEAGAMFKNTVLVDRTDEIGDLTSWMLEERGIAYKPYEGSLLKILLRREPRGGNLLKVSLPRCWHWGRLVRGVKGLYDGSVLVATYERKSKTLTFLEDV
jgi:hypothetical protein